MENMSSLWDSLAEGLIAVLPLSPFRQFIDTVGELPYLSWLNWFFPVRGCLQVMAAWLTAVTLFYLYSIVMRWIKMIGN